MLLLVYKNFYIRENTSMKVIRKQRNSRMCIICGLDNEAGVKAPFYVMEDCCVMTPFSYRDVHQSYPGRVHGGMITAMLDELGLRAYWAAYDEETLAVTMSLETKYKKPVPYDVPLIGTGKILRATSLFIEAEAAIRTADGLDLAWGKMKYMKLPIEKIKEGASYHEEMCYLIPDDVTEID